MEIILTASQYQNPIFPDLRPKKIYMNGPSWWSVCVCLVTQSCPTLCNSMYYSVPGFSVHWIFQARILEWDRTQVSCIAGGFFTV